MTVETALRQDRREEIIRASAVLFEKVGYHLASMQMIADAVGLGKPTLYHYFKSKSEILFEMHKSLISSLTESMAGYGVENVPADELLRLICRDTVKFILANPGYIKAFFEHFNDLDEEHQEIIGIQRVDYLNMISDIIGKGIHCDLFEERDPRVTALIFLGICNWTYQWLPFQKNPDVDELADTLVDVFLNGVLKKNSP